MAMIERTCVHLSERGKDVIARTRRFTGPVVVAVVLLIVLTLTLSTPLVAGSVDADVHTGISDRQAQQEQPGANTTQQNTSATGPTVTFKNQTSNGSTVTIESVTLPEPGFVAVHSGGYATGPAPAEYSIIAVSDRLSAGRHQNVTIDISNAPPGNSPGLNQSKLNTTQTLATVVYQDSNGNQQFDFVQSDGADDVAVLASGDVVSDIARVTVPTPPPQTASVVFRNQTLQNNTVTVEKARLPRGGFLIAHNASYRRTGDALTTAIGLTRYLPPGNHTNVSVRLLPGALNRTQTVTIRPSLDTNDNKRYDYINSSGFQDVAYEANSEVITTSAVVRAPPSQQSIPVSTHTQTRISTPAPTDSPTVSTTESPTSSSTVSTTPPSPSSQGDGSGVGGFINGLGIAGILGAFVVVVVGVILVLQVVR
jgi:hypothetical protein